jgi:hypothetical protein
MIRTAAALVNRLVALVTRRTAVPALRTWDTAGRTDVAAVDSGEPVEYLGTWTL